MVKHNITFRIDSRLDKMGEALILLVLTFLGVRMVLSTGVRLAPSSWDAKAMRPAKTAVNQAGMTSTAIMADITAKANILEQVFNSLDPPTVAAVRREYRRRISPPAAKSDNTEAPSTVLDWMKVFVDDMSIVREWTDATREKFHALAGHIAAVDPQMTFDDLNDTGLARLLAHFRSMVMQDGTIGMKNSTIAKQFGYLGWFMNWATRKGVNSNMAFRTFSPALKHTQKKIIFLTDEEIAKLNGVDLSDPKFRYLDRVRDLFLFQCYSGLRYSDVANLRWSDVKDKSLIFTTIKTEDTITVDLNRHTQPILDQYKQYTFPGNRVFPAPTNQEMNRHLKTLCRMAGIDDPVSVVYYKGKERIDEVHPKYELIGTHAGRRTFVVKALSLGISPYIVMRWTGHSSLEAMKPYMDIVDSAKAEAMKLFDKE